MAISAEQFMVLVLSVSCGVLGAFLLSHKGVRMMRGGLLYRLSIGLASVGSALSLSASARVALIVLFYVGYSASLSAHQMPIDA